MSLHRCRRVCGGRGGCQGGAARAGEVAIGVGSGMGAEGAVGGHARESTGAYRKAYTPPKTVRIRCAVNEYTV